MNSFFKSTLSLAKSNTGIFLGLGLLIAAIYGQSLGFDFVSYDDDYHVYNNLSVREFSPQSTLEILTGKTRVVGDKESQIYANRIYIPLTFLSFQLQHAITGLNPYWFHAANLLLFTLVVFSVYSLLSFFLKNKTAAFICAALFAIHPLNAEPTAWISGRKDLLCDLFFIQGFLFYANYARNNRKRNLIFSILFCLLATLSKPSGGIFIAVLLAYDFCLRRPFAWKSFLSEKVFFLLTVFFPVFHSATTYALKGNQLLSAERLLFSAGIPFFNLGHAVLPLKLSAFYPYPNPLVWEWNQIALIMAGAVGLIGLWKLSKKEIHLRLFAASFFFITLLPYVLRAAFFSDGGFTSDRYMLLPLIGLLLLFGIFVRELLARSLWWNSFQKIAFSLLGISLMVSFAGAAHTRTAIWKNSETLALDIVQKYPNAANAHEELGRIYQQRGLRTEAANHFKAAYLADPKIKRLIQLYELYGLNQPLIALYQEALKANPWDSRLNAGLGMVHFRLRRLELAQHYLEMALKSDSNNDKFYNVLAGALYYQNKVPQALAAWQQALAINPGYTDAANNLGTAYLAMGHKEQARKLFEDVLMLDPLHKAAQKNLEKTK